MSDQTAPTKTITVHFAQFIFGMVFMCALGALFAIGLDRQVQIEQSIEYEGAGK